MGILQNHHYARARIALQGARDALENAGAYADAFAHHTREYGLKASLTNYANYFRRKRDYSRGWEKAKQFYPRYDGRLDKGRVFSEVQDSPESALQEYPSLHSKYFPCIGYGFRDTRKLIETCLGPRKSIFFDYIQKGDSIGNVRLQKNGRRYFGKVVVPLHWESISNVPGRETTESTLIAYDGEKVKARVHTINAAAKSDTLAIFIPGRGSGYATPIISREALLASKVGIPSMVFDILERGTGKAHYVESDLKAQFMADELSKQLDSWRRKGIKKIVIATHSMGLAYANMALEKLKENLKGIDIYIFAQAPISSREEDQRRVSSMGIALSSPAGKYFELRNPNSIIVHYARDPLQPNIHTLKLHPSARPENFRLIPAVNSPYLSTHEEAEAERFADAMNLERLGSGQATPPEERFGHNGGSMNQLRETLWLYANFLANAAAAGRKK